jgi:hypothetical protein
LCNKMMLVKVCNFNFADSLSNSAAVLLESAGESASNPVTDRL